MSPFDAACEDFYAELGAYAAWDSEFSPNPHDPSGAAKALFPFGAQAVPVFASLIDSSQWGAPYQGFDGLRELAKNSVEPAIDAIEKLVSHPDFGSDAREVLLAVRPERFHALRLARSKDGVQSSMRSALANGAGAALLRELTKGDDEGLVVAALESIYGTPTDADLIAAIREVMLRPFAQARSKATFLLSRVPGATPAEALIEGMLTSGRVANVDAVAWHPDSARLVEPLIDAGNINWLADLLERRRCAGLPVHSEAAVRFIELKLRDPKREWRYEEHDVHDASRAALQLGDPALLPALVDAVIEQNSGYAWGPLTEALRFFGDEAKARLEEKTQTKVVTWMRDALEKPAFDRVSLADGEFLRGSIDHTTGGAFRSYSLALRFQPSAHAAFMLAWIDRAFGALLSDDRASWIRGLGFHDEPLLAELVTPIKPLEGLRFEWRKCHHSDAARVAAAGLPGLAFLGSRDDRHSKQAEAFLERVRAACLTASRESPRSSP